jgi:Kef-type K+ transport system membrane component KefB/nucleotide-binding universal stress UspA family protein
VKSGFDIATLLIQIATILALSRLMGVIFGRLRQPQVIGEMLAGIMLGPTLLGWVAPDVFQALFPEQTLQFLDSLAQVGVVLFLFLVGLEFDPSIVRQRGRSASFISASSILVPLGMGIGLTYLISGYFDAEHRVNLLPSALFMGAAISVTAFPVLARILAERNLQRTPLGALALTAAAVNDVLAWVMLAVVVAIAGNGEQSHGPLTKLLMTCVYLAVMLLVLRPFLRRAQRMFDANGRLNHAIVAIVFLVLLISAASTEKIGVHALFGAFVAGFIMPKGTEFVKAMNERLEDFTIVFLLPIFFAYAGLRTDLTGIFHLDQIGATLLIIVVACLGKIGGAGGAALLCGQSRRDALALGVLMNTRGLMELIILTVGLELGVINTAIYGMMVMMALVTTGMTAPLLALIHRGGVPDAERPEQDDKIYSVLIPVSRPESGGPLIEVASYLAGDPKQRRLVALHLDRLSGADLYRGIGGGLSHPADSESLAPLLEEAESRGIGVEPQSYFSRDIPTDIARVARSINSDLVLIGHHTPVFGSALLGGVVHRVMTGADCDVAVLVERDFITPKRLLVPFLNSAHDRLALELAGRIAKTTGAQITIVHVSRRTAGETIEKTFADPTLSASVRVKIVDADSPVDAVLAESASHDLTIIGVAEEWGLESSLLGLRAERVADECTTSLLIVRRYLSEE